MPHRHGTLITLLMIIGLSWGSLAALAITFNASDGIAIFGYLGLVGVALGVISLILVRRGQARSGGNLAIIAAALIALPSLFVSLVLFLVAGFLAREAGQEIQASKGLLAYKGRWGTPEEVLAWQAQDYDTLRIQKEQAFEREQSAKGFVKYQNEWMTPREKFEREQSANGLRKYIDWSGQERWGTPEQVRQWEERETARSQRDAVPIQKETVIMREIVKIKCSHCGSYFEETNAKCPNCGAKR